VVNLVIAAVVFVVLGGMKLARQPVEAAALVRTGGGDVGRERTSGGGGENAESEPDERISLTAPRIATLAGLAALVVAALVFDLDVGLAAITVAVLLSVVWPETSKQAITQITWPTVLLICGILTYVAVLQTMGTIKWAGDSVAGVGAPLLAALLICYIGAIVSAFASSVGIMGALIPLAVPFLLQGEVSAVGLIAALAVSATVVDVSPFSTNGALVLAGAQDVDRDRFFKQLMVYGGIMVVAAPPLVWLALVVPGIW
jgi:di/tricarboxylate transporter